MDREAAADLSIAFYSLMLDSRMVFSAADFSSSECSLDDAQLAALDDVCRILQLSAGNRFMDLGCGWGALVLYAAEEYGAHAYGCTVDKEQFAYCRAAAASSRALDRISFELRDCREVTGDYDRISAIGLIEHLGTRELAAFFCQVKWLLSDGGLFVGRSIVRTRKPTRVGGIAAGALATRADLLREAELAGLRIVRTSDFRQHYARTCHAWASRLVDNENACVQVASDQMYRTWLQHLRTTALTFEDGGLDAVEILCEAQ